MPKACAHNIPETLKGVGPCKITFEVRKRNGKPNWWCTTHGLEASTPAGGPLETCAGAWFDPVPTERQLDLDMNIGVVSVWGAIEPAIQIGQVPHEVGGVHVHRRLSPGADKDLDGAYDIVRLVKGRTEVVVESMAAVAFTISELAGQTVTAQRCPKSACGGMHIDEQKFATYPHVKHLCNRCGRNFRDRSPSISNPLADAYERLSLRRPPPPSTVARCIDLDRSNFSGIALWPSNAAIVSSSTQAEDQGVHVHAWNPDGEQVIDETYGVVYLDGEEIDPDLLRALAVQRAVAHDTPILSTPCTACGVSLLSPRGGWIEPATSHPCDCGAVTRTRRRVFLNPLADKSTLGS